MGRVGTRPGWRTATLLVLFTAAGAGLIYAFRDRLLVQGIVFAILGAGLSATARREETRRGKLARLSMGPFVFFAFLATIAEVDAALLPALVLWLLTASCALSDVVREDPLGVDDDRAENP